METFITKDSYIGGDYLKVRVINKKTKREVPSFMLHLYITYDEKGNMKCIDDEYELQFEDEEKDILEMMVDEDV